ncbi:MAG TPA: LysM domain-containing protein [Mycobacteriales bacterium]|nr:LysM domain-containing protein [Mycobacteriales bacterium]
MSRPLTGAPLGGVAQVKHRGDTVRGLFATLIMLAVAAGLPVLLILFFGNPLPSMPDGQSFADTIGSAEFLLDVIACIVWLAWGQFTACLIVELVAGIRGSGLPHRVPLAGAQQDIARRLVTAVLLLATASQGLHSAPRPGGSGPADRPVVAVSTTIGNPGHSNHPDAGPQDAFSGGHQLREGAHDAARPMQQHGTDHAATPHAGSQGATQHTQARSGVTKEYVVMPPHGRHHDSLWDIADRYLGSGIRYKEIFELNQGRPQPDGQQLTLESLIRPGWTLILPADAHGEGLIEVGPHTTPAAPQHAAPPVQQVSHQQTPTHEQAPSHDAGQQTGASHQQGGVQQEAPIHGSGQLPGPTQQNADQGGGGRHAAADSGDGVTQSGSEAAPAERSPDIPWDIVGAELLAAGLLESLIMLRRRRSQHRKGGAPVVPLHADGAAAEMAVRLGADPGSAAFLDHALRGLAAGLADRDAAVPEIYSARLTPERLELNLAVAQTAAPVPFLSEDEGKLWTLERTAALPPADDAAAPFPGLVSIGGDGAARVFVDLEAAGGPICVEGDLNAARSVVAAAAVELVTNRWSDDMKVTLVGFGNALAPISPDRLRCVNTLEEAVDEITDRLSDAQSELNAGGLDSVLTGRIKAGRGGPYAPEFIVLAAPPDPATLETLQAWAASARRAPLGILVAGSVPTARWRFQIDPSGTLDTGVLGFSVGAQQLSARSYAGVARLLQAEAAADRAATTPVEAAATPAGAVSGVVPSLPRPIRPQDAAVTIRIFGEPSVEGAGLRPGTPVSVELVTYVALVGEVSPRALAAAVWPYGVTRAERDAAIERAQDWLGTAADGLPRLRTTDGGRLRLADEVQLDWHQFIALTAEGEEHAALRALELVHGPLAEPHQARRYAWLARESVTRELPAYVIDVAHRLSAIYLDRLEYDGAAAASRAGLRVDPDSALLWDDLTTAIERRDGPFAVQALRAERDAALGPADHSIARLSA